MIAIPIRTRPQKYAAQPTIVDGIRFASKKEARRYGELKLLAKAGQINNLSLQPKFDFCIMSDKIFTYIADFSYWTAEGKRVVEDVKGYRTALYKLKKRIIEAEYGFEIVEI